MSMPLPPSLPKPTNPSQFDDGSAVQNPPLSGEFSFLPEIANQGQTLALEHYNEPEPESRSGSGQ